MGKNKKKGPALQDKPSAKFVKQVVGLEVVPPKEWPEFQRRLYKNLEESLLIHPKLMHLSVLPPGCLFAVFRFAPVDDSAIMTA